MTGSALRVGLVVPRFAPFHGGVETYVADAAAALAAEGAEVTVITQVPRAAGLPRHASTRRIHRRAPPPASRRHLRRALAVGRPCGIAVWTLRRRVGAQLPHTAGLAGGGANEGPTRVHPALPRGWPHSAASGPAPRLPAGRPATHGGEPPNRGGHRRRGGPGSAGLPPPGPARKDHRGTAGGGRSGAWTAAVSRRVARRADRRPPGTVQAHRPARPRGCRAAQPGRAGPARRRRGRVRHGRLPGARRSARGRGSS